MLCGGTAALVKAGFETLIEAGYQPEIAYFECLHELKLIVDLMYEGGLEKMRWSVSETAEWGDYVTGPRIITDATKAEMKKVLAEIQDGTFAKNWMAEYHAGLPKYNEYKKADENHLLETTGKELRKLMSWVERRGVRRPRAGPTPVGGAAPRHRRCAIAVHLVRVILPRGAERRPAQHYTAHNMRVRPTASCVFHAACHLPLHRPAAVGTAVRRAHRTCEDSRELETCRTHR